MGVISAATPHRYQSNTAQYGKFHKRGSSSITPSTIAAANTSPILHPRFCCQPRKNTNPLNKSNPHQETMKSNNSNNSKESVSLIFYREWKRNSGYEDKKTANTRNTARGRCRCLPEGKLTHTIITQLRSITVPYLKMTKIMSNRWSKEGMMSNIMELRGSQYSGTSWVLVLPSSRISLS